MTQLDLESWIAARPSSSDQTDARPAVDPWSAWMQLNPDACSALRLMALARVNAGARRVGMKALWEQLREHMRTTRVPGSEYRLNNNLTASAARWLLSVEPALAGKIEIRERRGDRE